MTDLDKLYAEGMALLEAADAFMAGKSHDMNACVDLDLWAQENARALLEGIAAMRRERDKLLVLLREDAPCNPDCSKWGHTEGCRYADLWENHLAVKAERDALQRDLDAALPDARRWQGYVEAATTDASLPDGEQIDYWVTGQLKVTRADGVYLTKADFDAAIDAATKAQP